MTLHDVLVPLAGLLVLTVPGLVVAVLAGLRPGTSVAVAPLLTYGMVTATATAASYVPLPWEPWTLVLVTVVTGAVVVGLRAVTRRDLPLRRRVELVRPSRPGWRDWVVVGGVLAGGGLAAAVFRVGFGGLDDLNQDWDAVFHGNALRLIADSGDIAPSAMARINDWETTDFYYPNTYHALGATIRDLTGASVFEVLNSQTMLVCLVAGMGLAGLLHRFGAPLAVTAVTPVLLAGFAPFPYDVLWRGPLLPYAIGVALIPAFVLLLDAVLADRRAATTLLVALGGAGLLGLHPSTALSAALFVVVYLVARWWSAPSTLRGDLLVLLGGGAAALLLAVPAVLGAVATNERAVDIDWPAVESPGQAVGDLLFLNHSAPAPQYWLAALVVVGLLTITRARWVWAWAGGAAIGFALFVASAASDNELVADLTRPWWNDRWRFAALAVLGMAPLAAHGLDALAAGALRALRRLPGAGRVRLSPQVAGSALVAAGLLLVVLASNGLYADRNAERVAENHQNDHTLDADEIDAMQWLADHSTGGTVMNDPNDGSAYLSAEAGLRPLFGHVVNPAFISREMGPTQQLLLSHFNCLDSDPEVRAAIDDLDIRYVFLGNGFMRDWMTRMPGLRGIDASPSLRLVHREPGVRVFEVDLTDTPTEPVAACETSSEDGGGQTG
ncbi:hypothetical protein SAMN05660690_0382 [Geodermatophilus telluris]|uniref:Uncharacterized protein n=1 Tax=Geodermatophilus telluris TaxID=1190417 RepID=A0A1G6IHA4_9ACTN|nr:DUF6541 family protein [Geodermatophilus telluris]SDC05942.1 hypothetical protein SAMN05660690_0382 [Geodermatophilus telluris]